MLRKTKKINLINSRISIFLIGILLFFYSLRLLPFRSEIYVLHDEFAYWAIAAKYAGFEWKDMMQDALYYSYGYSFFLTPLFLGGLDAHIMYKIAIILNALMIVGAYLLAYCVVQRLFPELSKVYSAILCGVISCYNYVTVNANFAWTEIVLYFSFWLLTYLVCRFTEKPSVILGCCLVLCGVIMFFIHQRTLGVIIAAIIAMLFFAWTKVKKGSMKEFKIKKRWLLIPFFALCFVFIGICIKNYNLEHIFASNKEVAKNDFSGQLPKLKATFSGTGIINLFMSAMGKYFYFGVATFLVGGVGVFTLLEESIKMVIAWRKRESTWQDIVKLFVILSFLGMFFITAISTMLNWENEKVIARVDIIFYGRYFEFVLGPVLLFGFITLLKWREHVKLIFANIIFFLIASIITNESVNSIIPRDKVSLNATGFNYFYWFEQDYSFVVLHGALTIITVFIIVLVVMQWKGKDKKKKLLIATGIVCLCWMIETNKNDLIIRNIDEENRKNVHPAVSYLVGNEKENEIYYAYLTKESNKYKRYAYYIQFNMYQTEIKRIAVEKSSDIKMEEGVTYIVMSGSALMEEFKKQGDLVCSSGVVNLFEAGD